MRQSDARFKACIAVTVHDKIYMYSNPSDITLVESARDLEREWAGWEHFNKALSPQEMVQLSINLGIRLLFKKGSKEELSQEVWEELCMRADDRRQAVKPISRDPLTGKKRGRKKQDLSSRRYLIKGLPNTIKPGAEGNATVKKSMLDKAPMTTRQAKKIYEFFLDEWCRTGLSYVTEGRMKDIVNDRAEELNTKQEPWRIFCYYRPELIDCQLIRLEK